MPRQIALKDPHREARIYSARTIAAIAVVLSLLLVILGRYYSLQITDYEAYRTQSESNRVKLQPLPPKRGLIFDRNGKVLAENLPAYQLELIPEQVSDIDDTLGRLAALGLIPGEDP